MEASTAVRVVVVPVAVESGTKRNANKHSLEFINYQVFSNHKA
jgi:hypothetical protein